MQNNFNFNIFCMLITRSNLTFILKNIGIYQIRFFLNFQHILVLNTYTQISNIKNLKLIHLKKIHIYKNGVLLTTITMVQGTLKIGGWFKSPPRRSRSVQISLSHEQVTTSLSQSTFALCSIIFCWNSLLLTQ